MKHLLDNFTYGQLNALVKKCGGEAGVPKVLSGEWIVGEPKDFTLPKRVVASRRVLAGLLELVGEPIKLPGNKRFVAREKFVIDRNGELPISGLGTNFTNNLLDIVEENVKSVTVKQRKLLKRSVDDPIHAALGGAEKAKIALAHSFEFLKTADRTKWYIFYIEGTDWAVGAYWLGGGWDLGAVPVSSPVEWRGGFLVVSR